MKRKKMKIKNIILKSITGIAVCVFVIGLEAAQWSDLRVVFPIMGISALWIYLFYKVNCTDWDAPKEKRRYTKDL